MVSRGQTAGEQGTETVSGYFRKLLQARPDLLEGRSNDELIAQWLQDHPGFKQVPDNVRANLANVKSVLRKKNRKGRGRPPGKTAPVASAATASAPVTMRASGNKLEILEERIDEGLTIARNLDREGLEHVIQLLRRARNEVVWKMGQ